MYLCRHLPLFVGSTCSCNWLSSPSRGHFLTCFKTFDFHQLTEHVPYGLWWFGETWTLRFKTDHLEMFNSWEVLNTVNQPATCRLDSRRTLITQSNLFCIHWLQGLMFETPSLFENSHSPGTIDDAGDIIPGRLCHVKIFSWTYVQSLLLHT